MAFPATLSGAVDGVTEIVAAHLNSLETKVGVDSSAVATSLDYLLKNSLSVEPGHKHSKLWASDGDPEAITVDAAGYIGFGISVPTTPFHFSTTALDISSAAIYHLYSTVTYTGVLAANRSVRGIYSEVFSTVDLNTKALTLTAGHFQSRNSAGYIVSNVVGVYGIAQTYHTTGTVANVWGAWVYGYVNGAGGTTTDCRGGEFAVNCVAGTITKAYAAYFEVVGAGTITTGYGIYVGAIGGSTKWSIYVNNTDAPSYFGGNVGIGTTVFEAGSNQVLVIGNGTAPDGNLADATQIYSADQAAGNACFHTRTEGGAIIKLFQGAALTTQLTTITHTAPGTPDYAIQDLINSNAYGFVTKDEGNSVLKVIANLQARVAELEARHQANGLLA